MAGDLNHPSGLSGREEWVGEHGLLKPTDPGVGTFASGDSLDKFLFPPGSDIPAAFLGEGVETEGGKGETPF